ncbi:hypothetical protein P3R38_13245 [Pseudomonas sp. NyZ480]|uniref:hypothetical protein n=1 Tax=Pseudomonas sp. NyZ480 TaxID=3035289 RepID=UPI002409F807|nr:hypothetical protein [Pseudomonas sp. NyZ480]WEZ86485.1 hypothetical protein P3R38_13245 [Pseudomonas sp. NyZ480]
MSSKGLIIDTNLLLLLVIGSVEEGRHIVNSKRLNEYTSNDVVVIAEYMRQFGSVYITPYIAAEVSNLIDLKGYARDIAFNISRLLFAEFKQVDTNIKDDSESDAYLVYGLTDNSLIRLVSEYTVLTNDNRLLGPLYAVNEENVVPYSIVKNMIG